MVQPCFVGTEKQSARAQHAVRGFNARVAIWTSKSQSASRFSNLKVAIAAIIKALAVFKDAVAKSKDPFLKAFRGL